MFFQILIYKGLGSKTDGDDLNHKFKKKSNLCTTGSMYFLRSGNHYDLNAKRPRDPSLKKDFDMLIQSEEK